MNSSSHALEPAWPTTDLPSRPSTAPATRLIAPRDDAALNYWLYRLKVVSGSLWPRSAATWVTGIPWEMAIEAKVCRSPCSETCGRPAALAASVTPLWEGAVQWLAQAVAEDEIALRLEPGAQMPRLHGVGELGRQLEHPATQSMVVKLALLRGLEALEAEYK